MAIPRSQTELQTQHTTHTAAQAQYIQYIQPPFTFPLLSPSKDVVKVVLGVDLSRLVIVNVNLLEVGKVRVRLYFVDNGRRHRVVEQLGGLEVFVPNMFADIIRAAFQHSQSARRFVVEQSANQVTNLNTPQSHKSKKITARNSIK